MDWRFSSDLMAYVDVARGWKAGGFAIESPAGQPFRFDPEVVTNTEVGIKSTWLDGRLSLNAAVFNMEAKDYQDTVRVNSLTRYLSNAGKVRNRGVEIEAQWRPSRQLELGATLGYLDAKYINYANPDGTNFNGNRVVLTPKQSIGVNATWRAGNGFYARADVMRYSDYYFNRENTQRQSGYTMVNAKIGYQGNDWEVFAFGENLAGAHYYERMFPGTMYSNLQFGSPEKPRRFGVGARFTF
jgi:iron complex outermembrane receptor protein